MTTDYEDRIKNLEERVARLEELAKTSVLSLALSVARPMTIPTGIIYQCSKHGLQPCVERENMGDGTAWSCRTCVEEGYPETGPEKERKWWR
jgi:hypothetical protein